MAKQESTVEVRKFDPLDTFGPIDRAFERMFGTWMATFPFRHPLASARHWFDEAFIPVDEFQQDGTLVVRAEMAGIDPDKDVDVAVSGGLLHIAAHRRQEETTEEDHYIRREMRYGSFERDLSIPEGVTEKDVTATYKDGILEVKVPMGTVTTANKVPVTKS